METTEERELVFILLTEPDDGVFLIRLKGLTLKSDMREKREYALQHANKRFKEGEIQ